MYEVTADMSQNTKCTQTSGILMAVKVKVTYETNQWDSLTLKHVLLPLQKYDIIALVAATGHISGSSMHQ